MLDMEFLYILPTFRGEGVVEGLLAAVQRFADTVKLSLTFGIQTGDRPLVKDRLMKAAGWEYVGGNFLRPAEDDGQEQAEADDDAGV